jgi:hypothetical protein
LQQHADNRWTEYAKPPSPLAPSFWETPLAPRRGFLVNRDALADARGRQDDSHRRTTDATANASPAAAKTSRHLTAKPLMMTLTLTQANKVQRRMAGGTPTVKGKPAGGRAQVFEKAPRIGAVRT